MGNTTATMKRIKALKRARKQEETDKAAHEYNLEQARELLKQGPEDTWTPASMGKRGGKARAKNLSKKELSEIGKKGAAKRWGSKPAKGAQS
jgi:hypothetical protein